MVRLAHESAHDSNNVLVADRLLSLLRIFLIEGIATVLLGLVLPWILIDFPETAKFMSEDERNFYSRRIKNDTNVGGEEGEKFKWKYLRAALLDWKIHLGFLVSLANGITGYG